MVVQCVKPSLGISTSHVEVLVGFPDSLFQPQVPANVLGTWNKGWLKHLTFPTPMQEPWLESLLPGFGTC